MAKKRKKSDRYESDKGARYMPTEEEIAAELAKIRAGWVDGLQSGSRPVEDIKAVLNTGEPAEVRAERLKRLRNQRAIVKRRRASKRVQMDSGLIVTRRGSENGMR